MKSGNIAIILLAAGASSRMGGIKQLLPWKGRTILEYMALVSTSTRASKVVVVLGAHAAEIRAKLPAQPDYQVVINEQWAKGLSSSIAAGMEFILKADPAVDGILIMLSDQPLMDAAYLDEMMAEFQNTEAGIVATKYREKGGVPALFGPEYYDQLLHLKGDFGAKDLLRTHLEDTVLVDAGNKVVDIDTPEAYRLLLEKNSP